MSFKKGIINNPKGRSKLSFSQSEIDNCQNTDVRNAMIDHQRRMDDFLKEIEARGGISELMKGSKTKAILQARNTGLSNFAKSIKHMRDGKGLISDPLLLTAVMQDMSYSPEVLFGISVKKVPKTTELTLSSGAMHLIQKAVSDALNKRETKQKRSTFLQDYQKIMTVLGYSKVLIQNDSFEGAIILLYCCFSRFDTRLFPHRKENSMKPIDKICIYYFNNRDMKKSDNNYCGMILTLSYLLYSINYLTKQLISITKRKKHQIIGFIKLSNEQLTTLNDLANELTKGMESYVETFIKGIQPFKPNELLGVIKDSQTLLTKLTSHEYGFRNIDNTEISFGEAILDNITVSDRLPYVYMKWENTQFTIDDYKTLTQNILEKTTKHGPRYVTVVSWKSVLTTNVTKN